MRSRRARLGVPRGMAAAKKWARPPVEPGPPKLVRPLVFRRLGLVLGLLRGLGLRALVLVGKNLAVTGVDLNLLDPRLSRDLDVERVHQATVLGLELGRFHSRLRRV